MANTLFDKLGGLPCIELVHRLFYDRMYAHPWLKDFLHGRTREFQESQQTNFMAGLFGGPQTFRGRFPRGAHQHLFITEEVFEIRAEMLESALIEAKVPEDLRARWLRYDASLKNAVVKTDVSECEPRYPNDPIIVVEKP